MGDGKGRKENLKMFIQIALKRVQHCKFQYSMIVQAVFFAHLRPLASFFIFSLASTTIIIILIYFLLLLFYDLQNRKEISISITISNLPLMIQVLLDALFPFFEIKKRIAENVERIFILYSVPRNTTVGVTNVILTSFCFAPTPSDTKIKEEAGRVK